MGQAIVVASGKGGTGKTTTAACISIALSKMGKRVLAIDCDIGLRNLDLAFFLDDRVVFDLADVLTGECPLEKAIIKHSKYDSLFFLSAPQDESKIAPEKIKMANFIDFVKNQFDFIIIDSPAGISESFYMAIKGAQRAILVTTPELYALRDAQKTADILAQSNITDARLLVNMVSVRQMEKGLSKNIDEIIDMVCLPLIGVVPFDERFSIYANRDENIMENEKIPAVKAFNNIARRVCGQSVPILKIKKRLFGVF